MLMCVFLYALLTLASSAALQDTTTTAGAVISPAFMTKAIVNFGQLSIGNMQSKLLNRSCLRIVVLGDSVTCGRSLNKTHPDRPDGKIDAWPGHLQTYLNSDMPCILDGVSSEHVVQNLAVSGKSTDHWVDATSVALRKKDEMGIALRSADIVIVETAVNDVNELVRNTKDFEKIAPDLRIKQYTELLVNILLKYPNKPSMIWLGTSSRGVWNGSRPRTTDAVAAHLPVTQYYSIPHISAVDGMGPLTTQDMIDWFKNVFRVDHCCHVTKCGHQIIAHLVTNLILGHYLSAQQPLFPGQITPSYKKRAPLFVSQSEINVYLLSNPLHIVTMNNADKGHRLTASPGWRAMEDVRGKPGFISNHTGDVVVFFLSPKEVVKHVVVGMLHVALLKSYEHMGTMSVEIFRADETNGRCSDDDKKESLGSQVIDCLWAKQVSEEEVVEVKFALVKAKQSCLLIRVEIIASVPSRPENKVKLLGFVIY
eukprot:CAMPEP_0119105920 /NCGR_PEP_ID=MMETSP1180-20130426/3752_1 /TAXON_ID=3052 ORGANISM="Chlamydomonas cf sp, Strain CCMP681" /NCGR_SAMPLE_ID=MMETSP1180 /ASSEMBLY_ACC=CAM_ASM_000741 /LENGTH=480 /DNA_ID=CAMNT_0007091101 /DNA_START=685 /DNA_END=2127 /DNA_ORIENTATION=+